MRKIFTLFAAMLVAAAVNAAIEPGTNALSGAISAADPGATIELSAGTFTESSSFTITKSITIKAADMGKKPILQAGGSIYVSSGADVKFVGINIKADGSHDVFDISSGGVFELDSCEIYNMATRRVIKVGNSAHTDAIKIYSCYMYGGTSYPAIEVESNSTQNGCDLIEIKNSTFANFTIGNKAVIALNSKGSVKASSASDDVDLIVDRCTFYNCTKTSPESSSTYGCIDLRKSSKATISNCIFANPASIPEGHYASRATQLYGGTVSNCLVDAYTPNHRSDDITINNPLKDVDPLFQDAENGDYTLSYGSPALTAGTDGKAIGDPRWVPNFYLTGTAAGATGAWNGHEIACAGTSYTIKNLAAGSYQLKLTRNGTWEGVNNVYGYDALSAKIGGLYRGTGDANDNICFTLADAGDVKVTFIYDEPLVFKVEGDFVMQNIQLGGSWASGEWGDDLRTFEPSEDKLTATLTMNFTANYYEFKVVENGTWNGKWAGADDKHYYYTRTVTSADNFEENKQTLVITPDVAGDYVFTWTYATRVLEVAFPAAPDTTYYIAGSFTDWGNNKVEMNESAGTWSKTININTTENLEYKVVRVAGFSEVWYGLASSSSMTKDKCTDWVIGGGEKPVGITTDETGDYTFIFNPAETKVSLVYPSATAVDNTVAGEKAVKVLRNGQLFIEKNGKTYNVLGTIVK